MQITTRTTGSDVIVEADGKKIQAFDHVEMPLQDARMQAEAYADGLRRDFLIAIAGIGRGQRQLHQG